KRWELIDELFKAAWVRQSDISEINIVSKIADQVGLNGDEIVEKAQSDETKQALRDQTDLAIANGVFGIPSIIWNTELFFGYDDFRFLSMALRGDDPLEPKMLDVWSKN